MSKVLKCNIDGNQIAYHREGAGQPVLFIHGITTHSFIWRKLIPFLASNYDVISLDLLGSGNSDKPLDVDYSIKNQARIIANSILKFWEGNNV